jgi:hypothetical protein
VGAEGVLAAYRSVEAQVESDSHLFKVSALPTTGSEMDELGRWMSAHSSIFIHLLSEICSCSLIHLKMDSTLVEGSLIHLKMDSSRSEE